MLQIIWKKNKLTSFVYSSVSIERHDNRFEKLNETLKRIFQIRSKTSNNNLARNIEFWGTAERF